MTLNAISEFLRWIIFTDYLNKYCNDSLRSQFSENSQLILLVKLLKDSLDGQIA